MHSVEVRQVPVRGVASVVSHASLGNWTTENRPMGLGTARVRPATAIEDAKSNKCQIKIGYLTKENIKCLHCGVFHAEDGWTLSSAI